MIDPEHERPPLSEKQRVALAVSQLVIGLFIILMAGTILHHYLPFPGDYGVHLEGVLIGIFVVLHIKRVLVVYQMTGEEDE